jgi:glucokinase-like ROK family protein
MRHLTRFQTGCYDWAYFIREVYELTIVRPSNHTQKATATNLKQHNQALILTTVYAHEAVSRVQLARLTHLSRPAVTEITQGLIQNGLIQEIGSEMIPAKVGKRATLLTFNPDAYHVIAADVGGTKAIGALLNLHGNVLYQQRLSMEGASASESVEKILQLVAAVAAEAKRPLLGVAVGTPGIVDSQNGVVCFASNLGWKDVPLASLLSERLQLPVYIGNDTNLAALGEYRCGLGQGVNDLVVLMLGTGIGSGIIVNGRIVGGSTFGAGEIGHIPFAGLDERCNCGRRGCLETVSSGWGLAREAQRIAREHPESLLNQVGIDGEINALTVELAAAKGDVHAIALIERMGYYLGLALTNLIHLLNPRRIIIGGSLIRLGDTLFDKIKHTVRESALESLASQADIVPSKLGDHMVLLGAGALVMERELGLWQF